MIVATCKLCRQLVKAGRPAPQTGAADPVKLAGLYFSQAFGQHIHQYHPAEMKGLTELLQRASTIGVSVAGWMAVDYAQSTDPAFLEWREQDRQIILAGLTELVSLLTGPPALGHHKPS